MTQDESKYLAIFGEQRHWCYIR